MDPVRRAAPVDVFAHPWMAKDHVVNTIHLPHFSKNIRRYKLKRKLKAAVVCAPRRTSRGRGGRPVAAAGRGDVTARRPPLAAPRRGRSAARAPRSNGPPQVAIAAEHRFLAIIRAKHPARYDTEAQRVARKHQKSAVFSPLGTADAAR